MAEKWEHKMELDAFTSNCLIDLYTSIAGVTSGYISSLVKNFGYSPKQAQKAIIELNDSAQKRVSEAYQIYQKQKEDRDKNERDYTGE